MVVPSALRILKLNPTRPYTIIGEMAKIVGWKYSDVVSRLEDKRKARASEFYARKKLLLKTREQAKTNLTDNQKLQPLKAILQTAGY